MSDTIISNADFEETCGGFIGRFKEHDKQSQELYDTFKGVFDVAVVKAKNSITLSGGLKDLSEVAKSLSSIRGDAITATTQGFNATMKLAEFKLKESKATDEKDELSSTALLMRQLTETINAANVGKNVNTRSTSKPTSNVGEDELQKRFALDIGNGNIKININEKSMKHDFNGVSYRYDSVGNTMVVIDSNGNKIDNYPIERIPEEYTFKRFSNGIPVDAFGREIKPYVG